MKYLKSKYAGIVGIVVIAFIIAMAPMSMSQATSIVNHYTTSAVTINDTLFFSVVDLDNDKQLELAVDRLQSVGYIIIITH